MPISMAFVAYCHEVEERIRSVMPYGKDVVQLKKVTGKPLLTANACLLVALQDGSSYCFFH